MQLVNKVFYATGLARYYGSGAGRQSLTLRIS
jgi:hypothetical protein